MRWYIFVVSVQEFTVCYISYQTLSTGHFLENEAKTIEREGGNIRILHCHAAPEHIRYICIHPWIKCCLSSKKLTKHYYFSKRKITNLKTFLCSHLILQVSWNVSYNR